MTKDELLALKAQAEKRWEELQDELRRLQGEHRILTKIIENMETLEKEQLNAKNTAKG